MEQLKVSTKSNPNSVAGAMAVKAVAIARGYVAAGGVDLVCVPTFADIEIDGERRTAIRLVIEDRLRRPIDEHAIPDGLLEEFVARETARTDDATPSNGHRLN